MSRKVWCRGEGVKELLAIIANDADTQLPNDARASLIVLAAQLQALQTTIGAIEKRIFERPLGMLATCLSNEGENPR